MLQNTHENAVTTTCLREGNVGGLLRPSDENHIVFIKYSFFIEIATPVKIIKKTCGFIEVFLTSLFQRTDVGLATMRFRAIAKAIFKGNHNVFLMVLTTRWRTRQPQGEALEMLQNTHQNAVTTNCLPVLGPSDAIWGQLEPSEAICGYVGPKVRYVAHP